VRQAHMAGVCHERYHNLATSLAFFSLYGAEMTNYV